MCRAPGPHCLKAITMTLAMVMDIDETSSSSSSNVISISGAQVLTAVFIVQRFVYRNKHRQACRISRPRICAATLDADVICAARNDHFKGEVRRQKETAAGCAPFIR